MTLLMLCAACQKLKQLATISVNIPYDYDVNVPAYVDTVTIPAGTGLDISLPPVPVATGSAQTLKENNTSPEKIVDLKLSKLMLKITQPPAGNFNFISAISVYLSVPGMPEVQVASQYNIPDGVDSLSLTCSGTDLKNYFLSDTMYIRLSAHFDNIPPPNTSFRIHSLFVLRANPLY